MGAPEVPPLCRETQSLGQQMLNAPFGINGLNNDRFPIPTTGTSGDTGGAAISAIEGRPHMHLVVLYPRGKISEVQYLQMVTSQHDNITVYSGERFWSSLKFGVAFLARAKADLYTGCTKKKNTILNGYNFFNIHGR